MLPPIRRMPESTTGSPSRAPRCFNCAVAANSVGSGGSSVGIDDDAAVALGRGIDDPARQHRQRRKCGLGGFDQHHRHHIGGRGPVVRLDCRPQPRHFLRPHHGRCDLDQLGLIGEVGGGRAPERRRQHRDIERVRVERAPHLRRGRARGARAADACRSRAGSRPGSRPAHRPSADNADQARAARWSVVRRSSTTATAVRGCASPGLA